MPSKQRAATQTRPPRLREAQARGPGVGRRPEGPGAGNRGAPACARGRGAAAVRCQPSPGGSSGREVQQGMAAPRPWPPNRQPADGMPAAPPLPCPNPAPTRAQHGRQLRRRQLLHRRVGEHQRHPQLIGAVDLPRHVPQRGEPYPRAAALPSARRSRGALALRLLLRLGLLHLRRRLLLRRLLLLPHRRRRLGPLVPPRRRGILLRPLQRPRRLQDGKQVLKRPPAAARLLLHLASQHLRPLQQRRRLGGLWAEGSAAERTAEHTRQEGHLGRGDVLTKHCAPRHRQRCAGECEQACALPPGAPSLRSSLPAC